MNRLRLPLALGALALLFSVMTVVRAKRALTRSEPPAPGVPRAAALPARFDPDTLEAVGEQTIEVDPFRLANAPARVRFEPALAGAPGAAPPLPPARPPYPALAVKAIMGGPPWQAVVDGLRGQGGMVVRTGDTHDKLVIARITADSVIVRGPDTTWKLTLKRGVP